MRYALLVAYDGTNYGGWQIQKNKITVQEKLEGALCDILGKRVPIVASGRTDSGVHAVGQVCHFDAEISFPPEKIADALNIRLPSDISVLLSRQAYDGFDANRSAKRKTYCYRFYYAPRRNPLKDRYSQWIKTPFDLAKLRHISGAFVGKHDFKAYMKSGSKVKTTIREIYSIEVKVDENPLWREVGIFVEGNGFLYNMVRTIAGTMLYYASGSLSEEEVIRSIEEGDRTAVGKTMPARGLTLQKVEYEKEIF